MIPKLGKLRLKEIKGLYALISRVNGEAVVSCWLLLDTESFITSLFGTWGVLCGRLQARASHRMQALYCGQVPVDCTIQKGKGKMTP